MAVTQALELATAQDIHICGGYAQYLLRRHCRAIHSSIREEERSMALHGWVRTIYFLAELVSPLLLNSSRGTRDCMGRGTEPEKLEQLKLASAVVSSAVLARAGPDRIGVRGNGLPSRATIPSRFFLFFLIEPLQSNHHRHIHRGAAQ